MPEIVKANMRQPCFRDNFCKGMGDYTWIKWSTIRMSEHEVAISERLSQQNSLCLLFDFMLCRPSAIMGHKRGYENRTVGGGVSSV